MKPLLEIALITKDRPAMVSEWMEHFGNKVIGHKDYVLSIHDGSENSETKKMFDKLAGQYTNLKYYHYDPDIVIDVKVIESIINSSAQYIVSA